MSVVVPQVDLGPQLELLSDELAAATARVMSSGQFILGEELETFETEFAAHCGVRHAVGVASGSDALELALRAAGIGDGDEVITVAHTFIATPLAISAVGAVPVFVDVKASDGLMDTRSVEAALTSRTRAIVPVHLYGRCVDVASLITLSRDLGLRVIEDAAQAHGATSRGRPAGSLGDAGCFSFYPSKNLGALGDAGAVVTDDDQLADSLRQLRNYGQDRKYHHRIRGRNSRLDELQAAILRVKLSHLEQFNAARRAIARRYHASLGSRPGVRLLSFDAEADAVHQAVLCTPSRDELRRQLQEAGIETQVHYPIPCHRQPVYARLEPSVSLPVTERLADEVLSLPMYPEMTEAQIAHVCDTVAALRPISRG
jgi:dTDP-4-amino-4,6-dideoxygalactose transaminase